ncbi:MAG: ATP-binding protein, partial [Pseudomonadota bacterium]
IEPEVLESVTQPFSQSDMSLRRSKEGLGLGLPLVIAIAKAHDAVFRLQSTPGAGAKAALVMPAMRVRSASGSGAVLSA